MYDSSTIFLNESCGEQCFTLTSVTR